LYQNSFGKLFLCNHEIVPVQPWNLVRLYVALLRTFPLSYFTTMPEPEPRPVICFTLIHLFRLRFNLEIILATSLPFPVPEPWPVICSASVHLFRLSLTLGNIPSTPVSCSTTASFFLRQISRPIQEIHDLLAVIALPGFQFAIQLECSFFLISSVYPPLLFRSYQHR
jgi:hypothetical protein